MQWRSGHSTMYDVPDGQMFAHLQTNSYLTCILKSWGHFQVQSCTSFTLGVCHHGAQANEITQGVEVVGLCPLIMGDIKMQVIRLDKYLNLIPFELTKAKFGNWFSAQEKAQSVQYINV